MSPFIAITVLDALLLVVLVRSLLSWWVKSVLIVLVLAFNFTIVSALGSYRGWPIADRVPAKAIFINCLVTEPSVVDHQPGSIYLWLLPLNYRTSVLGYHPGNNEPRAYREPYDENLQKVCQEAAKVKSDSSGPVVLARGGRPASSGHSAGSYHYYRLPPSPPVVKTNGQ